MRNLHFQPPLPPAFETPYGFIAVSWPGVPSSAGPRLPNLHFSRIFPLHRIDTGPRLPEDGPARDEVGRERRG
eukprot:3576769-Rhodomonas_salina.1